MRTFKFIEANFGEVLGGIDSGVRCAASSIAADAGSADIA
jgi:hypothetical protein